MLRALVVLLSLGQTVYEWTDSKGQQHYTDDASSIPPGSKRRVMPAGPAKVEATAKRAGDAGSDDADGGRVDACAEARDRIAALEGLLRLKTSRSTESDERAFQRCNEYALRLGPAGISLCHIGHPEDFAGIDGGEDELKSRLETERDALRRAQVRGCR